MTTFNNDEEKLSFLKQYKLVSKTSIKIPSFYYFTLNSNIPVTCEIVGYEDTFPTWAVLVIKVDGKLINVHSSYLLEMKEKGITYFRNISASDSYVVFDIETTGLNYKKDEIIEISAIKVSNNQIVEFNELVRAEGMVPLNITALTGITNEMLSSAKPLSQVLPRFLDFINSYRLVGHNIKSFDCYFINAACSSFGLPRIKNEIEDTLHLAQKALPNLENYKLSTLCNYYNIDSSNAHRALADCYICNAVYSKLKHN